MVPTMDLRVEWLKCVFWVGDEGRNVEVRMGTLLKRDWIWGRGFQPTKTSNLERATAISGLWFVSPNFSGSFLWSSAARSLSGWIWRGRALAMERIW